MMRRKKYQMPEADLAIATRCYRQAKTADELLECMKMHYSTIRIWFDPKLNAWVIHDSLGQHHKLEDKFLVDLPYLLKAQRDEPGSIAGLSGGREESVRENTEALARIEQGQREAAARRDELRRGIRPAPVKPASSEDLSGLFADLF